MPAVDVNHVNGGLFPEPPELKSHFVALKLLRDALDPDPLDSTVLHQRLLFCLLFFFNRPSFP